MKCLSLKQLTSQKRALKEFYQFLHVLLKHSCFNCYVYVLFYFNRNFIIDLKIIQLMSIFRNDSYSKTWPWLWPEWLSHPRRLKLQQHWGIFPRHISQSNQSSSLHSSFSASLLGVGSNSLLHWRPFSFALWWPPWYLPVVYILIGILVIIPFRQCHTYSLNYFKKTLAYSFNIFHIFWTEAQYPKCFSKRVMKVCCKI